MKRFTVHFTDEAWQPIQAQVRYIADENHAPENAARWLTRLLDAIDTLEQLPERNAIDARQTRIHRVKVRRMVFERTYLVFYAIDEVSNRVNVVSFSHGAQEGK